MWVDSHCHLDFPEFVGQQEAVVARAAAVGVDTLLTVCTRFRHLSKLRELAERFPRLYFSAGTHPHYAGEEEERGVSVAALIAETQHPKLIALGEVGLDYHFENAPRAAQQEGFLRHIEAARQTGLPLIIHARDADHDVEALLRQEMQKGAFKAILHCFSSSPALAWCGIELGLFVSFSGILTFKKSEELRELAKALPLDRILIETDAPYLAPVPHRGACNEPAYVVHTGHVLAALRGMRPKALALQIRQNFFSLFSKAHPSASLEHARDI